MVFSRFTRARRKVVVRHCGVVVAAFYAMVVVGVPLPIAQEVSRQWDRFPCESSACGCSSAGQCWETCCCSTLEEKIAWADKHGVTIPPHLAATSKSSATCCEAKRELSHCEKMNFSARSDIIVDNQGCCVTEAGCSARSMVEGFHKRDKPFVRVISALGCGGHNGGFPAVIPSLSPIPSSALQPVLLEKLCPIASHLIFRFSQAPPTPPPEIV